MKHFLSHLFLPHHTNNHRAKFLHHSSILLVVAFLFLGSFSLTQVEQRFENVLGITANISVDELLSQTNQKRQEAGLPPLSLNSQLSQAAAGKAQDMLIKNYWDHVAPDGVTPWVFIKGAGYEYIHAGENLARGFTSPGDVVNAWMASPGHRDNMLSSNYTEVGFAIVTGTLTGEETVLVVEMLGSRSNNLATGGEVLPQPVAVVSTPTPTPVIVAVLTPTPVVAQQVITPTPTLVPTLTSIPEPDPTQPTIRVASVHNDPLVNSSVLNRNIGLIVTGFFLALLLVDMFIIKRRKIVRAVSHHVDQILFFTVLLVIIVVVSRGSVL